MKFLCDNCKAKYQIPDEKIAGRTLRMNCRKCGSAIVIKGPPAEPGARRTAGPATGRRRGRSSVT
ncbi:MAG: zinc-ribbon domain-containing protein, partial [Myxococcota bacterium]